MADFDAPPATHAVRIALHLAPSDGGKAGGTFVATGLVSDSGVAPALERFAALRAGTDAPVVVHCADTFAGTGGTIAIDYDGIFRRLGTGVLFGQGAWRVTGGDHAYELLEARGTWTGTAVDGQSNVTVDLVFEGRGSFRDRRMSRA